MWLLIFVVTLVIVTFSALGVRKKIAYVTPAQHGVEIVEDQSLMDQSGYLHWHNLVFTVNIFVLLYVFLFLDVPFPV